jgi:4'-phosphopantetheinyl transferase
MISVFYVKNDIPLSFENYHEVLTCLPLSERIRIQSIKDAGTAKASLLGKILLKNGLLFHGYNPDIMNTISRNQYGKPIIDNGPFFSISHAEELVVCVISTDQKVGIDVELIKEVDLNEYLSGLHPSEIEYLIKRKNLSKDFFSVWTKKEAVIKADGRGFSLNLNEFDVLNSKVVIEAKEWSLMVVNVDNRYSCHLALEDPREEINLYFLNSNGLVNLKNLNFTN